MEFNKNAVYERENSNQKNFKKFLLTTCYAN